MPTAGHAALDPLYRAVVALACGPGEIKTRLAGAAELLLPMRAEDLPPGFVRRFRSIVWGLTEKGGFADTIAGMSEADAARLAGDVVALYRDFPRPAPTAAVGGPRLS